jgi:hypothetical protein
MKTYSTVQNQFLEGISVMVENAIIKNCELKPANMSVDFHSWRMRRNRAIWVSAWSSDRQVRYVFHLWALKYIWISPGAKIKQSAASFDHRKPRSFK